MTPQTPPTPAPVNTRRLVLGLLAVAAVIAVLCGVFQLITKITSRDPLAGLGQPVPPVTATPSAPSPTWEPPNMLTDAHPDLEIRHQLESWLLQSAGVAKKMSSRCDAPEGFTGGSSATFPCTVKYDKYAVVYEVNTKPSSSLTFTWDATAAKTVVTRTGLLAEMANLYRPGPGGFSDLRCEELPEIALVPTGTPLAQHCYVRIKGREKTATVDIVPGRSRVRLDTRLQ